jgi:hypothetical protein
MEKEGRKKDPRLGVKKPGWSPNCTSQIYTDKTHHLKLDDKCL